MPIALPTSKKERELAIVSGFIRSSGLVLRVADAERETPDFLADFEGRRIGVEVTEIFVPSHGNSLEPQARTSISSRVVAGAWKRYVELGGKPVHVSVQFTPHDTLREIDRNKAMEALATFILGMDLPMHQTVAWRQGYPPGPVPKEIIGVHLLSVPTWGMAIWTANEAGWVAPLKLDHIQVAVNEKAALLERYREAASEVWLIVAILGRSASQFFEIDAQTPWAEVLSPFDRTYFFAGFEGRAIRLGAHDA